MSGDALVVGSRRFRADREPQWRDLEALLNKAERKSVRALTDDELVALPRLYRATLSSLSVARATSLDADLIAYLEGLSARAYFFVYGVRANFWGRARRFLARDWPHAVRTLVPETFVAAALLLLGTVVGYILVAHDPTWYSAFVPDSMAGGRNPQASAASLRKTLYDGDGNSALSFLAAFLFTNNAKVAIGAFALGFAFGVPTALLLIYTGAMAGAFVALFAHVGLGFELGGWLLIHGTTELFAIVLAGAAGFRIGRAVAFPGELTRIAAAQAAGRTAATTMMGVVVMLLVAGLLEGFARQLIKVDAVRYLVASAMLTLWLGYYYWPRSSLPARG
ncbi:stage II sporulation protein M [Sphingosinicellaceae bacterium]|nr:stage II sporulation protein M [Sphingosinicellaceae bacterium]